MDYIEIACRWIFGLQMVFWGLNGFFHFLPIPPSSPTITRFTEACIEAKFIMPTVKVIEILCGALLIFKVAVPLSLICFSPIMFVVTLLHLIHNPKPWAVLAPLSAPFAILIALHAQTFLALGF